MTQRDKQNIFYYLHYPQQYVGPTVSMHVHNTPVCIQSVPVDDITGS